ncbi:2835_t:CDS:2, partial [Funneliformis mosseae]
GPRSLLDICAIKNYQQSFVDVNKLSLGLFNKNSMNLTPIITYNFQGLQNALSKNNIQHLQILINTQKDHSADATKSFLDALKMHSTSLTFLRIEDEDISTSSNQLFLS